MLLEGPTIYTSSDGVTPAECRFDLEHPLTLPYAGLKYAFYVQEQCSSYFDLMIDANNEYADGDLRRTGRSCDGSCILISGGAPNHFPSADLVFRVEFCRDSPVPVQKTSWGRLKEIYR